MFDWHVSELINEFQPIFHIVKEHSKYFFKIVLISSKPLDLSRKLNFDLALIVNLYTIADIPHKPTFNIWFSKVSNSH